MEKIMKREQAKKILGWKKNITLYVRCAAWIWSHAVKKPQMFIGGMKTSDNKQRGK